MKLIILTSLSALVALFSFAAIANHNSQESLESRVSAVGTLNVGGASVASVVEDAGPVDGESVYNATCVVCHGAGIAGAPAVGNAADWTARIAEGIETLTQNAINGLGAMPAKGGNPALSDEAVTAAVQFMVDQSQ